jgi:general secretion pathway protein A
MFTQHFQMNDHPFSEHVPVEHLLKDDRFTQALARLDYFLHDGLLALITGPTGVGKSSLLKLFIHSLNATRFNPVYVHLTNLRAFPLLKIMLSALGEDPPARGKDRLFLRILDHAQSLDPVTLFIIDEGQLLPPDALTDLRLLVSSGLDDAPKIKILLAGQDLLAKHLKRPSHLDLLHRISVRCTLRPLSRDQTCLYIDFRLKNVGANPSLFDSDAKGLIHDYSGGLPRLINSIATACLIHAASRNLQLVDQDLVNQTMVEFKLP